uniref:Uncharacterized protein n=1 Tax=Anguilla anguilla TaxID=7936 RepID=A0A0E9U7K9_ANGAN
MPLDRYQFQPQDILRFIIKLTWEKATFLSFTSSNPTPVLMFEALSTYSIPAC